MSRRRCDKHPDCKGCICYTDHTKDMIENIFKKYSYEEVMKDLNKQWIYENLTGLYSGVRGSNEKFKREYICAMHYYNPNGIYNDD